MKQYIPDLIPDQHRVLPDYFREADISNKHSVTSAVDILWWVLAVVAAIVSLFVWSHHAGFGLSLLLLAFFASPWGRKRLENALRFRFTFWLKTGILSVLALSSSLTGHQYSNRLEAERETERLVAVAKKKAEEAAFRQRTLRLDSLHTYLTKADASIRKGTYAKAIGLYKQSLQLATDTNATEQHQAHIGLAIGYFQSKQYQLALQAYDQLVSTTSNDTEFRYKRALCYQRLGQKTDALADLYKASKDGYAPATKLYNQLNPELRRILYYQTVCCDGSYSPSNAKGRGACSHHGGVCNWDKPIYETYRKYDFNGL
ncbi:hypothetical protein GCM10028808_71110 [Spirosoma migulaei]